MSSEETIMTMPAVTPDSGEIVRRFMEDLFVQKDPEAVDNYFADEVNSSLLSRTRLSSPPSCRGTARVTPPLW